MSVTKDGCPPPRPDAATQAAISKRDGLKCCITGKFGYFWDPLVVVPVLPIPNGWIKSKLEVCPNH